MQHELFDRKILLSPLEAAEITGISRSMLYVLINSGELQAIKIGKAIRIPSDSLKKWLEDKLAAAQQKAS